jgi:hypothetical protein
MGEAAGREEIKRCWVWSGDTSRPRVDAPQSSVGSLSLSLSFSLFLFRSVGRFCTELELACDTVRWAQGEVH